MVFELLAIPAAIIIFFVVFFVIGVLATIFWIWMIVDCAQKKFKNENDKIIWILIIVLTGVIGAIIYYFVARNK